MRKILVNRPLHALTKTQSYCLFVKPNNEKENAVGCKGLVDILSLFNSLFYKTYGNNFCLSLSSCLNVGNEVYMNKQSKLAKY